jgi:hypothetical protein
MIVTMATKVVWGFPTHSLQRAERHVGLRVKRSLLLSNFSRNWKISTNFKLPNIKFHENPFNPSGRVTCGDTVRQTGENNKNNNNKKKWELCNFITYITCHIPVVEILMFPHFFASPEIKKYSYNYNFIYSVRM